MKQTGFTDLEYAAKTRVTRRDRFLGEIDTVTPWSALVARIEPRYPKGEGRGRPPIGLEWMRRMYIAQQCFGLSDEGIEAPCHNATPATPGARRCQDGTVPVATAIARKP